MPNYTFTAPDGKQITVTGPEGSTVEQAFQIAQQQYQAKPLGQPGNPTEAQKKPEGSTLGGIAEGTLNTALRGVATPAVGLAGFLAPSGKEQQNIDAANSLVDKYFQVHPEGLKTQAANNAVQQAVGDVVSAIPKGLEKAYDFTHSGKLANPMGPGTNASREAWQKAALNVAANVAPMMFGPKITPGKMPEASEASSAQSLGYKIPPSDAVLKGAKAPIGRIIEGLTSSDKLKVAASVKNQAVTNKLAADSIGVQGEITPDALNSALEPHYKVYQQVKALGTIPIDKTFKDNIAKIGRESEDAFPEDTSANLEKLRNAYLKPDSFGANGAVLKIRQLRKDGNLNIASRDPERMQLGYAQREIAGQIEDQIDRYASSRPEGFDKSGLIKNFRNARQEIAKIETVRNSITPGTTDVSAAYLAKQPKKNKPLSGKLQKIAETYNNFPVSMRNAGPLRQKVPVNMAESFVGGGLGIAGAATHNPKLLGEALLTLGARPALRHALLSDAYQSSMTPKAPLSPLMLQLLSGGAITSATTGNQ